MAKPDPGAEGSDGPRPQPEPPDHTFQQAKADHDFNEQELELKPNTELTREIDRLTIELHSRLLDKPAR